MSIVNVTTAPAAIAFVVVVSVRVLLLHVGVPATSTSLGVVIETLGPLPISQPTLVVPVVSGSSSSILPPAGTCAATVNATVAVEDVPGVVDAVVMVLVPVRAAPNAVRACKASMASINNT